MPSKRTRVVHFIFFSFFFFEFAGDVHWTANSRTRKAFIAPYIRMYDARSHSIDDGVVDIIVLVYRVSCRLVYNVYMPVCAMVELSRHGITNFNAVRCALIPLNGIQVECINNKKCE